MDPNMSFEFGGIDGSFVYSSTPNKPGPVPVPDINNNQGVTYKFTCEICNYKSQFKQNLSRHMKVHNDDGGRRKKKKSKKSMTPEHVMHECDVCDYQSKYKQNLKRHQTIHLRVQLSEKEHICDKCGKVFKSKFANKLHVKTFHEKSFTFRCPTCMKGFNQRRHYIGHLASHHTILKEKCDICPAVFAYKSNLQEHVKSIHQGVVYNCPVDSCSAQFTSASALRDHRRAIHRQQRLICPTCNKSFKWRSSLRYHRLHSHKPAKAVIVT